LIGGLALGGITLLVGPESVAMGLSKVRNTAQGMVGSVIDDPTILRMQLQQLADQYPDRIAEVRGELAQVEHQLAQLERDVEVATRVVAMTTDDLTELRQLVTRAEAKQQSGVRTVAIRHDGVRYDVDEAYTEAHRINHVRQTYADRLDYDKQQTKFLGEHKVRLQEILGTLESEFSTYQAQLYQLEREIESIERNDRLIELTQEQEATLRSFDRFGKVANLKQIQSKLAELRAVQQAQLESLSKRGVDRNYEARAEFDLNANTPGFMDPFADLDRPAPAEEAPSVEEISNDEESKNLVWNGPAIVE
jgi:chromosome segregation ATPase